MIHAVLCSQKLTLLSLSSTHTLIDIAGGMGPPPTGSRDHLKIEKDGRLVNRATAPGNMIVHL